MVGRTSGDTSYLLVVDRIPKRDMNCRLLDRMSNGDKNYRVLDRTNNGGKNYQLARINGVRDMN